MLLYGFLLFEKLNNRSEVCYCVLMLKLTKAMTIQKANDIRQKKEEEQEKKKQDRRRRDQNEEDPNPSKNKKYKRN